MDLEGVQLTVATHFRLYMQSRVKHQTIGLAVGHMIENAFEV